MDAEVVQATLGGSSTPWSVDRYLTAAHRDDAEHGCAFPAMLSEVARADEPTRMALARAIDARARELARVDAAAARGAAARQRALATLASASAASPWRARCAATRRATKCSPPAGNGPRRRPREGPPGRRRAPATCCQRFSRLARARSAERATAHHECSDGGSCMKRLALAPQPRTGAVSGRRSVASRRALLCARAPAGVPAAP